jgi:GNAT superfamily N-acetyltransferase
MRNSVQIRRAGSGDASDIARLSTELGYPATDSGVIERINRLLGSPLHAVFVADADETVVGWIAGELRISLETGARAEITGLVVDTTARRAGIGRALVATIERWALENEVDVVLVRSNVTRAEAHPFYVRLGYKQVKTQHSYKRVLHA